MKLGRLSSKILSNVQWVALSIFANHIREGSLTTLQSRIYLGSGRIFSHTENQNTEAVLAGGENVGTLEH